MLKILQVSCQQYVKHELPDIQAEFRKGRGTRDQIANIHWIIKKAREFQKNIYFFIIYSKASDCVDHNKLGNSSRNGNTRLPCCKIVSIVSDSVRPHRLPYLPPKKTVLRSRRNRTRDGTTDWFQTQKGVHQGCILSPCLFNLHVVYIMRSFGLDEAQVGVKIGGEMPITSDTQMIQPLWQRVKRN